MHIKSSVTLTSFKNQVRKVDIENLQLELTPVRTVTCTSVILNGVGRVSEFVSLFA